MPTPSLTLRKPAALSPEAVAAFVGSDEGEPASPKPQAVAASSPVLRTVTQREQVNTVSAADSPSFQRASRAIAERKGRAPRRRTTIYFDVDVVTKLAAHLKGGNQQVSDVVNDVVRAWLDTKK
jgi:hypothetical protein